MTVTGRRRHLAKALAGVKAGTILDYCTERFGVHRGAKVAAEVAQWTLLTAELGYVPTTVAYADWWAVEERTGWRHRANIAEALGPDWQVVVLQLAAEIRKSGARSPRAVVNLQVA